MGIKKDPKSRSINVDNYRNRVKPHRKEEEKRPQQSWRNEVDEYLQKRGRHMRGTLERIG